MSKNKKKRVEKLKKLHNQGLLEDYYKRKRSSVARKVLLGLGFGTIMVCCSACSTSSSLFGGSDIQISATEEGMKAYGDHINALVTNAKAPDDAVDTPAYQLRREQNRTRMLKFMPKAKLQGGGK